MFGIGAFGLALQILRTPLRFIGGQQVLYLHVSLPCYFIVLCLLYPLLYLLLTAVWSIRSTHSQNILPRVRHFITE